MALGTSSDASARLSASNEVALLRMQPTLMRRSPCVCTLMLFCMTTKADMKVLRAETK